MSRKNGTETSTFGVSTRENHDSSKFYNQKVYEGQMTEASVEYEEKRIPEELLDTVQCQDSRDMSNLPDKSLHLMITSPPYVAAKEYDEEWTLEEYITLLHNVFAETYQKLVPGGRACVNIANIGRSPYIPLHSYIVQSMLDIGYMMRGEIIWDKGASVGGSTAWGSWQSASNPCLRDVHEYILIFSKQKFGRPKNDRKDTIKKQEFLDYSKSVWEFQTASAKKVGHPAPFPEELPRRLIQLYSFENDVVMDPFAGSGTTCIAAARSNRHYIGFDKKEKYVENAHQRIEEELEQIAMPV
jgi:site-specific DNA-methyltransferase (adenine-specific)